MKMWVVPSNEPGKSYAVVGATKEPKNSLGEALWDELNQEWEDGDWLQIEKVDDGEGNMVDTITVNQSEKDRVKADRQAKEDAAAAEGARKKDKLKAIYKKMRQARKDDIQNLEDVRQRIDDLTQIVVEILTSEEDDV